MSAALKNSSTTQADAPHRLVDTTTSARAAEPPQRSGPGANSEFDSSRDYFPVARQATATRPAHDAPTFAQAVAAIALDVPDFHTSDHDRLPMWDPERAACATCMSDEQIALEVAS